MIEKKTVSQCISSDYCIGWNDAVDAMPHWISTKDEPPKSQEPVFVCAVNKTTKKQFVLKAAHIKSKECTTEDYEWQEYEGKTEYDEENDCFWIPECWYECNAFENNVNWNLDGEYDITHWMPMPEPPDTPTPPEEKS